MENANTVLIVYQIVLAALGACIFWFVFLKFGSLIIAFFKWVHRRLTKADKISQLEERIQELERR